MKEFIHKWLYFESFQVKYKNGRVSSKMDYHLAHSIAYAMHGEVIFNP